MTPYSLYYLAYGSNLHPGRLKARLNHARLIGAAALPRYALTFHKKSKDGSGKCNLFETEDTTKVAYGAVFEIGLDDKPRLDQIEGKRAGYREEILKVTVSGKIVSAFMYVAEHTHIDGTLAPYDWYHAYVVAGAEYHGFPKEYIEFISRIAIRNDPDPQRAAKEQYAAQALAQQNRGADSR